jgi:hypothetical protein
MAEGHGMGEGAESSRVGERGGKSVWSVPMEMCVPSLHRGSLVGLTAGLRGLAAVGIPGEGFPGGRRGAFVSLTASPAACWPGSGPEGSQQGKGQTGTQRGSLQGSWSGRLQPGAGGEGVQKVLQVGVRG